jgi:RNA polymerase sigma-70 factor, ECF subfamily
VAAADPTRSTAGSAADPTRSIVGSAARPTKSAVGSAEDPARPAVGRLADGVDAETADWLIRLRADDARRDAAIVQLHELLVRIARAEVNRRAPRLRIAGPELDDIAHQAAADALLAITGKLHKFRGESRFTTWAYKFVVFDVSAKIGRHFWRDAPPTLDAEDWDRLPDRLGLDPARESEWRELIADLRRLVDSDLSDHQRRVFVAIVLHAMPLDALAIELGSNRNAIYKTLFDARRKLRSALVARGHLDDTAAVQA